MSAAIPFATLPSGPLVLASASATRRGLLERAGFDVICIEFRITEYDIAEIFNGLTICACWNNSINKALMINILVREINRCLWV